LFEEIRLLANLETETAKLLSVILVGQQELADRLNEPSLRQLKQRVVLRCVLAPLDAAWTASYIATRLRVAGASPSDVFTKDAVVAIYEASRGIPRTIGVICENALLAGFAAQKKPVDRSVVVDVCRDLDVPVNGGRPVGYGARPDHAVAHADEPAPSVTTDGPAQPEASPPRWRTSPWFSSRGRETRPEPAAEPEAQPERASNRTRIFKF
jgi:general secretion pathway protein A